ncbi:MAG: biotin transporter BioY [Gemmatimonadota bacterium]
MAEGRRYFWPLTMIAGAAAVAVAAQVSFQLPGSAVPGTLQGPVVLLAGGLAGALIGGSSLLLYLLLGVFGAPVFAGGASGLGHLFGPTGGYLFSFPIAAAIVGRFGARGRPVRCLGAALAGMAFIQLTGALWLKVSTHAPWSTLQNGLGPLLEQDLVKVIVVALILWPLHGALRPAA